MEAKGVEVVFTLGYLEHDDSFLLALVAPSGERYLHKAIQFKDSHPPIESKGAAWAVATTQDLIDGALALLASASTDIRITAPTDLATWCRVQFQAMNTTRPESQEPTNGPVWKDATMRSPKNRSAGERVDDDAARTDRQVARLDRWLPASFHEGVGGDIRELVARCRERGESEKRIRRRLRGEAQYFLWLKLVTPLIRLGVAVAALLK